MSPPTDPRRPRPNPELRDIERVIRSNWSDFSKERDHARKRGYGMVLQAALEQWLDEPEHIMDLAQGPAEPRKPKEYDPHVAEGGEGLFDTPGEAGNTFFYLTYSGVLTTVFHGRETDPFDPWDLSAYWVLLMEKLFVTENETVSHFTSESAFHRHVGGKPGHSREGGSYFVIADPRGYYDGGSAMVVARYATEVRAREKARACAEAFGIRFAVANNVGMIHTH